jgi:hypothetical protein
MYPPSPLSSASHGATRVDDGQGQPFEAAFPVFLGQEGLLLEVPALRHMMRLAWHYRSCDSGHAREATVFFAKSQP